MNWHHWCFIAAQVSWKVGLPGEENPPFLSLRTIICAIYEYIFYNIHNMNMYVMVLEA